MHAPKMPAMPAAPAPPPPPPTVDQAALNVDQQDMMRKRRGRAADLLAPIQSPSGMPVGAKALLG